MQVVVVTSRLVCDVECCSLFVLYFRVSSLGVVDSLSKLYILLAEIIIITII